MSVLETLGKVIPPPSYVRLPSAGVDVSDTSVKYVQFKPDSRSGTQLKLLYWGDIDIAEGVLKRGEVSDPKKLSDALKEVRERTGVQNIRLSLPEERAYLFETDIQRGTPYKEIRGLLEFRLEENVPLSPRDAFFDYEVIDDDDKESVVHVLVTAYARDTVMSYYEACLAANVVPMSFEVEAQAIARATLAPDDKHTHVIVDFGKMRTGIGIVHKGMLMYASTIDIGGEDLNSALKRQLGEVDEAQLVETKNTKGLIREVESTVVYDALLPTMSAVADEIATRIQYWDSKNKSHEDRQIESIILCGGSVNMKGLPGYFTEVLGIEAERADVWQNAFLTKDHVPAIGKQYSYGYATAVGLALTPFI